MELVYWGNVRMHPGQCKHPRNARPLTVLRCKGFAAISPAPSNLQEADVYNSMSAVARMNRHKCVEYGYGCNLALGLALA